MKDLDLGDSVVQRDLGVKWDLESDTFGFRVKIKDKPFTRCGILSVVSSVYVQSVCVTCQRRFARFMS